MIEIWKDIEGYEGLYQVSNQGNVRSLDRYVKRGNHDLFKHGVLLKQGTHKQGYKLVYLSKDNLSKTVKVHRLVAMAFIDRIEGKNTVNHINAIKDDNRPENLEWTTQRENILHATELGLMNKGSKSGKSKLFEEDIPIIRTLCSTMKRKDVAELFGVSRETIASILRRRTWIHV
jgi:hypothetical protein